MSDLTSTPMSLGQKVAGVTGGTRGLGLAIAMARSKAGAAVMVASRAVPVIATVWVVRVSAWFLAPRLMVRRVPWLSTIVMVAVWVPASVGAYVTFKARVWPVFRLAGTVGWVVRE